ncbi:hypothetical protein OH76DRAFT_1556837 [Lentinus brumalis]|uniref:Uncharacterized protein n=1 Tax=Lentinus brumalis TaxID=2498619 RepID=A0A371D8H4_9APHY|nr:hypothetical protein OH76DRAFT_1556837 [Polyporus brumalis]
MNDNTTDGTTPATLATLSAPAPTSKAPAHDAASLKSETSTLNDAKDTKGEVAKKEGSTLGPSSTSFAKKAKEQGWAAPTAARPSFGGYVLR